MKINRLISVMIIASMLCVSQAFAEGRYEDTDRGIAYIVTDEPEKIPVLSESSITLLNAEGTWHEDANGWWFEYSGGGYPSNTWEEIDSYWYYFNESGYMITGWIQVGDFWYFCETSAQATAPHGSMITGWREVDNEWYFFETAGTDERPLGAMITGWHTWDGNKYYFREINEGGHPEGSMVTGWVNLKEEQDNNYWCFFNFDTGICEVEGQISKGCEHGKTTYLDLKLNADISSVSYIYYGAQSRDAVEGGIEIWEDSGLNIAFHEGGGPMIGFLEDKLENNVLAVTRFIVNGVTYSDPRSAMSNWQRADIFINTMYPNIPSGTIGHELGHAFGLDHRDTDETSIMYRKRASTGVSELSEVDKENIRHIYNL